MFRLFLSLYLGIMVTIFSFFYLGDIIQTRWIVDVDNLIDAENLSAEIQLLETFSSDLSQEQIDAHIHTIAKKNQAIIESITLSEIPENIQQKFTEHQVWFDDEFYNYFYAFEPRQYFRMSEDEEHPLLLIDSELGLIILLVLIVSFALTSFAWMYGLMMKLRHLEDSADKFSQGHFSERASIKGRYRVGRLNQRFNEMAQRIEHLIAAQKQQTQMVAHELRSPLFRLHLQLDLLEQSEKDQQAQHIQGIEDDICHLEELVNELLEYGKVFRAELSLNFQPTIMHSFINDLYRVSLKDSTAKISLNNYIDSKLTLPIDSHYLTRAIVNLLTNANKYAKTQISLTSKAKGDELLLIVEDDGCGIAVGDQDKIFQPYFRSEQNSNQKGYGLGLPICQEVLRLHQGKVSVEDSELGGAKFIISMPIKPH